MSKKSKNQTAATEELTPTAPQETPPVVEDAEGVEKVTASEPPVEDVAEEVEAPPPSPKFDYEIAPGRSLTSLVGILGPGCEVKESHFSGGSTTLKAFVASGHVLDNKK